MNSKNEGLHQRLERLRRRQGLSAKAMARLVGVPESTYREWEYGRGLKLPPFQEMRKVLAISVTELVTGDKPAFGELLRELEQIEVLIKASRLKIGSLI